MIACTLNEIRAASPCPEGWTKLLAHLGKTKADDTSVNLEVVLDSNGLDDALWVLDNVIKNERIISLFSADCAERVLPIFEREYPNDDRPRKAIAVARDQNATEEQRNAARAAARVAAEAARAAEARWAARAAEVRWPARDAARAAATIAARAAATIVAWSAGDAAWAAARDAAGAAQSARLRQYCRHGEAAAEMPWPDMEDAA